MRTLKTIKIMFTDFWRPQKPEYIKRTALYKMLASNFNISLSDTPEYLIYSCFGHQYLKYGCMRIFYTGENVRPNFSECDYAFSFDYPVSERNYRLPLYRFYEGYDQLINPRKPQKGISETRKFACFLASNPDAPERNRFFEFLSEYKKVDSGGKILNNLGYLIPRGEEVKWMSQYKFCISFENSCYPGYTTEKIMYSFLAGCIPIYWGNPQVSRDFNPKAFVNCHDHATFEEVVEEVKKIDKDDGLYSGMMSEPFLPRGEETEFCKEENIIQKFDQIFSEGLIHVSLGKKRLQRLKFPVLASRDLYYKKILPKAYKILKT